MAGYSGTPLPKKLGIGDASVFTVVGDPGHFEELLGDYGDAVWQQTLLAPLDVVVAFHTRRQQLVRAWPKLTEAVEPDGTVWVCWPKKASGMATDLDESVVRARGLAAGVVDVKVAAVDDTWSALKFVRRLTDR